MTRLAAASTGGNRRRAQLQPHIPSAALQSPAEAGANDSNETGADEVAKPSIDIAVEVLPPLQPPPTRGDAAGYTGRRTAHKGALITPATPFSGVSGSAFPAWEGASLVASTSRGGLASSPTPITPIISDEERLAAAQRRLASVHFSGAAAGWPVDESQARAEAAEQRRRDAAGRGRARQVRSVVGIQPQSFHGL